MGSSAILAMMLAGLCFVAAAVGVCVFVSHKLPNPTKGEPYECGVRTEGPTWAQFNVGYYLFSLCFLIFDVEMVFLYPWAVTLKQVGTPALVEIFIFMIFLFMGLLYAYKQKALKWK